MNLGDGYFWKLVVIIWNRDIIKLPTWISSIWEQKLIRFFLGKLTTSNNISNFSIETINNTTSTMLFILGEKKAYSWLFLLDIVLLFSGGIFQCPKNTLLPSCKIRNSWLIIFLHRISLFILKGENWRRNQRRKYVPSPESRSRPLFH